MQNQHGEFIWYELLTTDADAAVDFYSRILNWQVRGAGMPDMDYRLISAAGTDIAGLMTLPKEAREDGAAPGWLGYIAVDDVDTSLTDITQAGGQVFMPAQDIPNVGRLAMLSDPQGVPFYIMRGSVNQRSAAFDPSKLGHCCWNELTAIDTEAALTFYQQRFGWQKGEAMPMGDMGVYQLMRYADSAADMGAIAPRMDATMTPVWTYYFGVEDIDIACEQIATGGGSVNLGPHEVPGGAYIVIGSDPQGASFALVGPRNNQGANIS